MTSYLDILIALTRETIRDPRSAARSILTMNLPRDAVWSLLGLVAVTSMVATLVGNQMLPDDAMAVMPFLLQSPIAGVIFLAMAMIILSAVLSRLGQLLGGAGTFGQALRLIVWSQILMVALQLVQTIFLLISPAISALIGFVGFFWFIWLSAAFTAELHEFDGSGKGLVVAVLAVFATVFALMILLVMTGIKPMVEVPNV